MGKKNARKVGKRLVKPSAKKPVKKSTKVAPAKKKVIKKPTIKKPLQKKAASKRSNAKSLQKTILQPKFRAVCLTENKAIGNWLSSESAAQNVKESHEAKFPNHVTDIEQKG